MPSVTVEDYLKRIYVAELESPDEKLITMGEVSEVMQVQAGTVTSMMKALVESGLVIYEPRKGVCLTPEGRKLASRVLRSHRIIELFLVEVLGYDWSEVHAEAENLEHAISDKLLEKMDSYLGHPDTDPHGDPIPNAAGELTETPAISGEDMNPGEKYRLIKVSKQESEFLKTLSSHDLTPGSEITCSLNDKSKGIVTFVSSSNKELTLSINLASNLFVTAI